MPRDVSDRFESLTDRERQVYQLLAEGNSNKDIANRLNLSLHTVETHRWRIMEKLDLHSTAELVLSAVRRAPRFGNVITTAALASLAGEIGTMVEW